MTIRTIGMMTALWLSVATAADGPPTTSWERTWDGDGGASLGDQIAIDPTGHIYVAGRTGVVEQDLLLLKYDEDGALLWERQYDGPGNGNRAPTDIEITPEGVSVIAASPGRTGPQTVLLDYDSDGELLGERRTIGPDFPGFLRPQLAVGSDGRRIIATDDNAGNAVLEAYASDGSLLFTKSFALLGFSGVSALEIDTDFSVCLVLVGSDEFGSGAYLVRRYDAAGNELWSHDEPGDTGLVLGDAFVAFGGGGDVVIAGSPEIECVTVKSRVWRHDIAGTILYSHDLPLEGCDFGLAVGLACGSDGATYVVGSAAIPGSLLARILPDGTIDWVRSFFVQDVVSGFRGIAVTDDDRIIVGGTSAPPSFSDVDLLFACYDTAGNLGWTTVVGLPDVEEFFGAIDAGGEAFAVVSTSRDDAQFQQMTTHRYAWTCEGDVTGDGVVDTSDLLAILGGVGQDPGDDPADVDGDGDVDTDDMLIVLASWGRC